ncbi:MAG: guanylate kinase [Lachnospiraceae bacterium]|nr:guanylate kinase [Lachnospiraceae bacterium]MDE7434914.1 guanylate kinase [Lachnospiraceae bacterium]
MGKLYCLMGKSSTGKDSIYRLLLQQQMLNLGTVVPYTTRPIRAGETEGENYHFISDEEMKDLQRQGMVIELRAYHTVHGIWKYATVQDGRLDLSGRDYLVIGTLDAYEQIREYFGKNRVIPIYIEVEDGLRLQRALERERQQAEPKYEEMCRRFLADASDFSEERIAHAEITRRFSNKNLQETVEEITAYMLSCNG